MSPRMEVVARQPQLEVALISSQGGGYPPSGGIGLVLLILVVLMLMGRL